MFSLLLAVIIGTGFAILATQNTIPVAIHVGGYTWNHIPLYAVAIGSLVVGLLLAYLLSIFQWATSSLLIHGKEARAHKAEEAVARLEAKIKELEIKNAELSAHHTHKEDHDDGHTSPLSRLTHSFSH